MLKNKTFLIKFLRNRLINNNYRLLRVSQRRIPNTWLRKPVLIQRSKAISNEFEYELPPARPKSNEAFEKENERKIEAHNQRKMIFSIIVVSIIISLLFFFSDFNELHLVPEERADYFAKITRQQEQYYFMYPILGLYFYQKLIATAQIMNDAIEHIKNYKGLEGVEVPNPFSSSLYLREGWLRGIHVYTRYYIYFELMLNNEPLLITVDAGKFLKKLKIFNVHVKYLTRDFNIAVSSPSYFPYLTLLPLTIKSRTWNDGVLQTENIQGSEYGIF